MTTSLRARVALICVLLAAAAALRAGARPPASRPPEDVPRRVVSLVPAVTEMLFAIGSGAQVVGVSSFDRYPPEAETRTRVGALVDPNVERILSLRPDLVVVYDSQDDLRRQLAQAGIHHFAYRHGSLADVFTTLEAIGTRVGRAREAAALAASLRGRLDAVRKAVAGRPRPRTLLVFGRDPLALRSINASGGIGFLHDVLGVAGADNVFADVRRQAVQATTETILARAPELIVELKYGRTMDPAEIARERAVWASLAAVPAVKQKRIVLLVGDEFVVPGPRLADATETLARAIHPSAFAR